MTGARRTLLNAATSGAHHCVEGAAAKLDLRRFEDYRHFLQTIGAALLPLENFLVRCGVEQWFPDWPVRTRRNALAQDLAALGLRNEPAPWARPTAQAAELYGMMYVLEGSRLGAHFMLNRVLTSEDSRVRGATHFLRSNEAQLWRSFLRQLENAPEADDAQRLVRGAREGFRLFGEAFARARTRVSGDW